MVDRSRPFISNLFIIFFSELFHLIRDNFLYNFFFISLFLDRNLTNSLYFIFLSFNSCTLSHYCRKKACISNKHRCDWNVTALADYVLSLQCV